MGISVNNNGVSSPFNHMQAQAEKKTNMLAPQKDDDQKVEQVSISAKRTQVEKMNTDSSVEKRTLSKEEILQSSSTSMLLQANANARSVLQLLEPA